MSVPKPPSSLDNSCAVIHDKTLYTFTGEGLLSLPLTQGAKWKKLASGEKVIGAKCVGTDSGLYVVGGLSDNKDYAGLQKYTYGSNKWDSITPTSMQLRDRQWHGVTYIKAVDRLVVYGGKQDNAKAASSETFTVQASEPYEAQSYQGSDVQLTSPILLPFSDADAVMIAGDPLNKEVTLFNQDTSWRYWLTLADPLPRDTSTMNAIVVAGDDGSKNLLIFDVGASPNEVKRVVLADASGAPVANSAPVGSRKRDLTLDDWPEYNSTLAPKASRTNFAMAYDADGMVVFAGGNDEDPISIFDTKENTWLDPVNVLAEEQKILAETESSSETQSKTSSSSSSRTSSTKTESETEIEIETSSEAFTTTSAFSSEAFTTTSAFSSVASSASEVAATNTSTGTSLPASDDGESGLGSNVILGITLGSILGFLALLGLLLLCLRRRQNRNNHTEAGHSRKDSGRPIVSDEKNSRGFANGAQPPLSPGYFRGHHHQNSGDSFSSMAMLMGRPGQKASNGKTSHDTIRSLHGSAYQQFKNTISKPIPHPDPVVEERDPPIAREMANVPGSNLRAAKPLPADGMRRSSGWNRYWSGGSALQLLGFGGAKRNTGVSDRSSRYSDFPHANSRVTQDSATVPPLNFEARDIEGRASFSRVNTGSPKVSHYTHDLPLREGMSGKIERPVSRDSSGYSSGVPESINEVWDPTAGDRPWGAQRAPSSAYTNSFYSTPLAPNNNAARQAGAPSGVSQQPQLAMASTSDMSWLNLGDQRRV